MCVPCICRGIVCHFCAEYITLVKISLFLVIPCVLLCFLLLLPFIRCSVIICACTDVSCVLQYFVKHDGQLPLPVHGLCVFCPQKGGQMAQESIFLSAGDAAAMLNVSKQTVMNQIFRGNLKAFRFGNMYRIRKSDLEEFLERSAVSPKPLKKSRDTKVSDAASSDAATAAVAPESPAPAPVSVVYDDSADEEVVPFDDED